MFSYYGSKSKVIDYYPAPKHSLVIEPFAGSARYALKYWDRDVILVDKNPLVVKIWEYLKECSEADIRRLPNLKRGTVINREMFDCEGEYSLMRFMIVQAAFSGNNTVTSFGEMRFENNRSRVLKNLFKVKHWEIRCGNYSDIENVAATYFVDPPYEFGGHKYTFSNRNIDFNALAEWCRTRNGQTIVCENSKASWMEFVPVKQNRGMVHTTTEVMWTNEISQLKNTQLSLL